MFLLRRDGLLETELNREGVWKRGRLNRAFRSWDVRRYLLMVILPKLHKIISIFTIMIFLIFFICKPLFLTMILKSSIISYNLNFCFIADILMETL